MAGPINWLSQVASVTKFGLLGIPRRLGSVISAIIGIMGVVAVLVGVLSMAQGFRAAMANSAALMAKNSSHGFLSRHWHSFLQNKLICL